MTYGSCAIQAAAASALVLNDDNGGDKKANAIMILGSPVNYPIYKRKETKYGYIRMIEDYSVGATEKKFLERMAQEAFWMHKIFLPKNKDYTQCYVNEHYFLPRIYRPYYENGPVYIVVPSLEWLLDSIFYDHRSVFDVPNSDEGVKSTGSRLEDSVELFNKYMQEQVYSKYDIKALVLNYSTERLVSRADTVDETARLQQIDTAIRSFGTLLYQQNKKPQYSINPQVFWLFWYKKHDFTLGKGQWSKPSYTDIAFLYDRIQANWFPLQSVEHSDLIKRQAALLYPLVKACASVERINMHKDYEYKYGQQGDTIQNPIALLENSQQQIALVDIDTFQLINNAFKFEHITQVLNDPTIKPIPPERFRFPFGIKCHYVLQYAASDVIKRVKVPFRKYMVKNLFDPQKDTLTVGLQAALVGEIEEEQVFEYLNKEYVDKIKKGQVDKSSNHEDEEEEEYEEEEYEEEDQVNSSDKSSNHEDEEEEEYEEEEYEEEDQVNSSDKSSKQEDETSDNHNTAPTIVAKMLGYLSALLVVEYNNSDIIKFVAFLGFVAVCIYAFSSNQPSQAPQQQRKQSPASNHSVDAPTQQKEAEKEKTLTDSAVPSSRGGGQGIFGALLLLLLLILAGLGFYFMQKGEK